MKLIQQLLVISVVILVIHNLHGKVFPAKAMSEYEDTLAIMWEVLDTNKDGSISASELKSADADADGAVSLDELLDYTNKFIDEVEVGLQQVDTNIDGTYEIQFPESGADNSTKLEINKDGEGQYSATVSYGDQSIDGTDVVVSGNKCTFKITETYEEMSDSVLTWNCTINDGELSVELSELLIYSLPTTTIQGKRLDEADRQLADTNFEGTFEMDSPIEGIEDNAILELKKDDDGEYSATISFDDHSIYGIEVTVLGNKCTFETVSRYSDMNNFVLNWECTNNDGELTVEMTPLGIEYPAVSFKGKLLVAE